ncbi:hypothetical protein [Frateuria sp. YIM B11624]|uniref:hypothetical protein n=1 Tax=Frateuria sp. YIM B11624 TaxID=3143185 RepID=UPI003C776C58
MQPTVRSSLLATTGAALYLLLCAHAPAADATTLPLSPAAAKAWFDEATRQCEADHGRLWGKSLCGPRLLVDPATRKVIANQADAEGRLHADGGVFVGTLPASESIANTAVTWAGVRWSEMLWPLPEDALRRRVLMTHEAFHRIQDSLGLPAGNVDNPQLDTLEGRYTLQLEWRALDAALTTTSDADRRARATDALAFRAARYRRFPAARQSEATLERNEGLAEYTGVMVGSTSPAEQLAMARHDLAVHAKNDPSFVRSFAYATGPAYGMLLDRYRPGWRKAIVQGGSPAELLATALHVDLRAEPMLEERAARYGGAALLASERARAEVRTRQAAAYQAQLIAGPVLHLPLGDKNVEFDPRNLMPLGAAGTVYPTMHVIDAWGWIEVDGGALMAGDWSRLTVAAPEGDAKDGKLHGKGWTMQLAPGWRLVPGTRKGDWTVAEGAAR